MGGLLGEGEARTICPTKMTVDEATRALNLESPDFVYRLLRARVLKGRKVEGRWNIDPDSVAERKRRVAAKASSKSNAAAERARRMEEAEGIFA
jgi:hypothetical protein